MTQFDQQRQQVGTQFNVVQQGIVEHVPVVVPDLAGAPLYRRRAEADYDRLNPSHFLQVRNSGTAPALNVNVQLGYERVAHPFKLEASHPSLGPGIPWQPVFAEPDNYFDSELWGIISHSPYCLTISYADVYQQRFSSSILWGGRSWGQLVWNREGSGGPFAPSTTNESNSNGANNSRVRFDRIAQRMPELVDEMRKDLIENPLYREFIVMKRNWSYWSNDDILCYYYDDHVDLDAKLTFMANVGAIRGITYNNTKRFIMTEEWVDYLGESGSTS